MHYPTPIDDCLHITEYVIDHPEEFSIDRNEIFLFGDSAGKPIKKMSNDKHRLTGGNLAVAVEHRLREKREISIRGLLLLYPFLQMVHFRLPSYEKYFSSNLLSLLHRETLTEMINFYLNTSFSSDELMENRHLSIDDYHLFYSKLNLSNVSLDHRPSSNRSHPSTAKLFDPLVSPLLADDEVLRGSPSTLLIACHYDIFLSEIEFYHQRLKALGVDDVHYRDYPIFHGAMSFVDFPVAFSDAFQILADCAEFLLDRTMSNKR